MKRIATHILIAIMLFSLGSCGSRGVTSLNNKECIYVSIAPLRPLVSGIVGNDFDIEVLVPTGASPESFEPAPRQFIAANQATAIFAIGLIDFERNLLSKIEQKEKIINLSQGIELISGSCSHSHNCTHPGHNGHSHHSHGIDPHIWTSPMALKIMARNTYDAISARYPDSVKYKDNYEYIVARLDSLDHTVRRVCDKARTRQFVINHPALTYLARDYGLEQISIEHDGKEPSAKRLANVINQAREDGIKQIFYQATYPRSTVEIIADDIGAKATEIDPLREDIFSNIEEITRLITE